MSDHPYCEATLAADPDCKGWIEEGWEWHGCSKDPDHDRHKPWRQKTHVCKCGVEWSAYKRRSKTN